MREPENGSIVVFEWDVDKEFWFRDDELAVNSGADGDERWFEAGDVDGPISWVAVLNSNPDVAPVLLERSL